MSENSSEHSAKRLARLAAVQGLYQIAHTQVTPKEIIQNFRRDPSSFLHEIDNKAVVETIDQELFSAIVTGVIENGAAIDEMLAGALSAKMSVARIEILLRAILQSGAYELHHRGSTATGIIINDYVDVTHAFFGSKEPALVNAVLDKLAKNLR